MRSIPLLLRSLIVLLLASALPATWSIILIDIRTGEIAIASATCLTGFDLQHEACVVVVGRGAAAAQSSVDFGGANRTLIFAQLQAGTSPAQILSLLAASDNAHQTRQYGIVDTLGRAIAFTGTGAGQWAGHATGQVGTIWYAVQGNVLTGPAVVGNAVLAIQNTPGDLAEKLMAAMEAARAMGGDGRCSCNPNTPTSCGAPPASFAKSAHVGYMLVARPGDVDGTCSGATGCANGSYYMNLNVAGAQPSDPDPVVQLRARFLNWRLQHVLRPDHFLSTCSIDPPRLLDDGQTTATLRIVLRDWRGAQLPFGGAAISIVPESGSVAVPIGAPIDHNDGTYTVALGPAGTVGTVRLRVNVDDGAGAVRLTPVPVLEVTGDSLWVSHASLDAQAGGGFDAVLRGGATFGGRSYLLLASLSGTTPGVTLGPGLTLPLEPDALTFLMYGAAPSDPLLFGALDAQGRRLVTLQPPPGVFLPFVGRDLSLAWLSVFPIDFASNSAALQLR